ncbi:MAG: MaoC family dehydratase [Pelagibacterales bacterium]|nr:MaoC family dehydratase [Pelagibacterales bacterium]
MNKPYSTTINSLNDLQKYKGKEIGLSDWFYMSQDKINIFADITEDSQWIHLDAKRAAKESPYKKTIAHGFLVLSYATQITFRTLKVNNIKLGINYGLDKVRFPNATPSNSYFRGRVSLIEFEEVPGGAKYKLKIVFEVKGETKPVCVAETLSLVYSDLEE